jgi:heme A synthase
MQDIFKGFLMLRLIGLLALLIVVAVVLGIWSLTRGSDIVGVAILAGVVVLTAAIGMVVARRRSRRLR